MVAIPRISKKQYNYALAWTSIWILSPLFIREWTMDKSHPDATPDWFSWNIIFAAAASCWHWQNNKPYSVRHITDVIVSSVGITAHIAHLCWTRRAPAAVLFAAIIWVLFRRSKAETSDVKKQMGRVHWTRALFWHASFRYAAFALSVYTHRSASPYLLHMSVEGWVAFWLAITFSYGVHLVVLAGQKKFSQ